MSARRSSTPRVSEATDSLALLNLPFPVFVCSIARLLVHLGYQNVAIKKPLHGTGRGRNSQGGFDIEAYHVDGLVRTRAIIQVKQHTHPVPRSFVDELRGAMVRQGALQGLLFTAGTFSPAARLAAQYATNSLPLRLVDGAELARLLVAKEVPIRADTGQTRSAHVRPVSGTPADPLAAPTPPMRSGVEDVQPSAHVLSNVTITLTIGSAGERHVPPPSAGT